MHKINIKFLTEEALDTLKGNAKSDLGKIHELLHNNPNNSLWLEGYLGVTPFITKQFIIEDFSLPIPKDDKDKETELKVATTLYEHLNVLPGYVLADERFWLWILFEKGYETALKLMPVKEDFSGAVFKDHWLFSRGNRRSLTFGVLSREYFRTALTVDESNKDDKYQLTRLVIEKPDRLRNFTWRNYSDHKTIVMATLKAAMRVLDELELEDKAKYYEELAKRISQLGSVAMLETMSEADLESIIYQEFKDIVLSDPKPNSSKNILGSLKENLLGLFSR